MTQQEALVWIQGGWQSDPHAKRIAGRLGIDVDGYYGFQCVDFVKALSIKLGHPFKNGNARTLWENPQDPWYTRVLSPQPGDTSVFKPAPSNGNAGHTSAVTAAVVGGFTSVDQNWGAGSNGVTGLPPAAVRHTMVGVYGFLRPKFKQGDDMPATYPPIGDQATVRSIAATLGQKLTDDQVAYYAARPYLTFYDDMIPGVNADRIAAQEQVADLQAGLGKNAVLDYVQKHLS